LQSLVGVKLHNATKKKSRVDLVIKPEGMGVRGVLGVLLEPVKLADPGKALIAAERLQLRPGESIGEWYSKPGDRSKVDRSDLMKRLDLSTIYDLSPTRVSEIRGIELDPGQSMQAVISCKGTHKIGYGQVQRFSVMQRQDGEIVGGSTFEIRLRRAKAMHPVSRIRVVLERIRIRNDHDPWLKGRGEFSFSCVTTLGVGSTRRHAARLPARGTLKIDEKPGRNEHRLETCVFDGYVSEKDSMTFEIFPTEHDLFDSDDKPCVYRRRFSQPPETWVGKYRPDDEGLHDAERLPDWDVYYRIESLSLR
jgi:hypothetical protein